MAEALNASLPEAILDYQRNGTMPAPPGNRDAWDAPHGVYRLPGRRPHLTTDSTYHHACSLQQLSH
jgi:hypothetical protein